MSEEEITVAPQETPVEPKAQEAPVAANPATDTPAEASVEATQAPGSDATTETVPTDTASDNAQIHA